LIINRAVAAVVFECYHKDNDGDDDNNILIQDVPEKCKNEEKYQQWLELFVLNICIIIHQALLSLCVTFNSIKCKLRNANYMQHCLLWTHKFPNSKFTPPSLTG